MLGLLAANPLLTIMLVVSLGTLLGAVPSGPVRFGTAGALFVGLGVGAPSASNSISWRMAVSFR